MICSRKSALIFWNHKKTSIPAASRVTRVFVCKQIVISFGVLFVLKYSFHHSFIFVVDILFADSRQIKFVSLIKNVNQNCCQNRCLFKIAILFLWERSSSKRVRKRSRPRLELTRVVESALPRTLLDVYPFKGTLRRRLTYIFFSFNKKFNI